MLRNRAVAFLLCCLASRLACALGLGSLEATSALNEPFTGRIEVLGAKPEDFDTLTIALAGEEQFRRAGIERAAVLFQLRFSLADSPDGKDYISVTSRDSIRERAFPEFSSGDELGQRPPTARIHRAAGPAALRSQPPSGRRPRWAAHRAAGQAVFATCRQAYHRTGADFCGAPPRCAVSRDGFCAEWRYRSGRRR